MPGGPNKRIPLGNARIPWKRSGRVIGQHMSSVTHFFANSNPDISSKVTGCPRCIISDSIFSTISLSQWASSGGRSLSLSLSLSFVGSANLPLLRVELLFAELDVKVPPGGWGMGQG